MEQTFGAVLSGLRKEREMSLRELGHRTTFSHVYLWQIERGEKRPTVRVAEACDRELRAGGELLALLSPPAGTLELPNATGQDAWPAGQAERSTVTGFGGLVGPVGDEQGWDAEPPEPDSLARSLWDVRARFERLYRETGGVSVRPRLNEFLRTRAMPLLDRSDIRPDALAAIAAIQALAAACAHDCLDRPAAEPHARFALLLAQRSARLPIIGYALSVRARFELWVGRPDGADEHVERALSMRRHFDPALLSDLYCLRAETCVRHGEVQVARDALVDAARQVELIDVERRPEETRYLMPGSLEVRRAEVLRRAGDLDGALAYARAALVLGSGGYPRGRAHASTVYARVLADRGDLPGAAQAGRAALEVAAAMESRLLPRRLVAIGRACAGVDPALLPQAERLLSWLV